MERLVLLDMKMMGGFVVDAFGIYAILKHGMV